jgi:hypothetical protein
VPAAGCRFDPQVVILVVEAAIARLLFCEHHRLHQRWKPLVEGNGVFLPDQCGRT